MYTCMSDPKIYQTWLFLMDHWSPYARVLGSGPRGPWFDLQRGRRLLWPWASHKSTYPGVMVRNWSTHYALKKQQQKTLIIPTHENVKHGSLVVIYIVQWPLVLEVPVRSPRVEENLVVRTRFSSCHLQV